MSHLRKIEIDALAETDNNTLSPVSDGSRTDITVDRKKRLIIDSDKFLKATAVINSFNDQTIIASPGAGYKLQVYAINISLSPEDISYIWISEIEGVEFSGDGGGNHWGQSIFSIATLDTMNGNVNLLSFQPHFINLQHGHVDCDEDTELSGKLMGVGANGLNHNFYITAWYRIMPV